MLQFAILHRLNDKVFQTGLNSSIKLENGQKVSGLVVLQTAILFSNVGHLKGTLASESALFEFLNAEEGRKTNFLASINGDNEWSEFANGIFTNFDLYKVKYLIAINLFQSLAVSDDILEIVKKFFTSKNDTLSVKERKYRWLFNKVRQISFVYLDSFNSDFPFHVDISKVLLNINNYKTLFNPNSSDFELFFDAAETTLTKKLYIAPGSVKSFVKNKDEFKAYLTARERKTGNNKLSLNTLLTSLISSTSRQHELVYAQENTQCYQYYLSQADIELFGIRSELFNYNEAFVTNYSKQQEYNSLINKQLRYKGNFVQILHDGRKTLYFLNLIVAPSSFPENDQQQFLLNYFNLHAKFLGEFKYSHEYVDLRDFATVYFRKHYSRKVFLHLLKMLFKCDHYLSSYVMFEHHFEIEKMARKDPELHISGFLKQGEKAKARFGQLLDKMIDQDLSRSLTNNFKIARRILDEVSSIQRYVNIFYCLFPVALDKYTQDPKKLYEQKNPEELSHMTDLDLAFCIFNSSKYEFYIIEGKKQNAQFRAAVIRDFNDKIKPNLRFPDIMPDVQIVDHNGAKGGYICYSN